MANWIIVCMAILTFGLYRTAYSASCCKTEGEREVDLSGEERREVLMRGVQAMDQLHRFWFQKRMLDSMRLKDAPAEASVWRTHREQQRRSISSEEWTNGEKQFRKYTLRIVGVENTQHFQRLHRQRQQSNSTCPPEKANHYAIYSKLPSVSSSFQYKTHLEKAELELWRVNDDLPHLQLRNWSNGEQSDGDGFLEIPSSSWTVANHRDNDGWTPLHPDQHQNATLVVVDLIEAVRSVWSMVHGLNATISLVYPNGQHSSPCNIANTTSRSARDDTDEDTTPAQLVLKLSLIEKAIRSQPSKRSIGGLGFGNGRRNKTNGGRRQLIIQDCERQWDSGFLRETPTAQYDDLMPCCRRKVHIDFQELGWGSWVIFPLSFDSYYCMGRCTNFGGFASEDTSGAAFYTEAMNLYQDAKNSGLTPCCSPVKFSPLTITVLTGDNEEMTQTLEDVIVKQCGCM